MGEFFDFIFVVIAIISVISFFSKIKKAAQSESSKPPVPAPEDYRRKAEEARRAMTSTVTPQYTPQVAPHVAPHAPTVHSSADYGDCEAHRPPESSEGSPVRAHAHTAQDVSCDAHTEPKSTEGETREERLERLRRRKAERDRQLAIDARYDEQERQSRREARIRQPEYEKTKLSFSDNAILQGIVYSEILRPPVSKRR